MSQRQLHCPALQLRACTYVTYVSLVAVVAPPSRARDQECPVDTCSPCSHTSQTACGLRQPPVGRTKPTCEVGVGAGAHYPAIPSTEGKSIRGCKQLQHSNGSKAAPQTHVVVCYESPHPTPGRAHDLVHTGHINFRHSFSGPHGQHMTCTVRMSHGLHVKVTGGECLWLALAGACHCCAHTRT